MSSSDEYDEERDDEEEPVSFIKEFSYKKFFFKITENEDEYPCIRRIVIEMFGDHSRQCAIGKADAYLIDRSDLDEGNIHLVCDAISSELEEASSLFCKEDGSISEDLRRAIRDPVRIGEASGGGFLYIDQVEIKRSERGGNHGLLILQALFDYLNERWTLAGMYPTPWGKDIDPLINQDDRNEKLRAQTKVFRHFGRLGFRPFKADRHFAFLEESQLKEDILPKESTRDIKLQLEPLKPDKITFCPPLF
mmetsp:Transcript_4581/g.7095  ORF Transcript_4581/g.7095 Transcript_4581/m.7095 type:complete len:250 (-) Transcript_4581:246-995(-)